MEPPKRVIFLDCDGVINYTDWYISDAYRALNNTDELDIDPDVIDRLNRLCDESGAKIVISSSWKIDTYHRARLEHAGLKNIIDKTPDFIFTHGDDYSRGSEIDAWLSVYPVDNYVIIDDCIDFTDEQMEHLVKCDPKVGFTEDLYKMTLNMIKANPLKK